MKIRTKEYITWVNIKQRCFNKNSPDYKNYGSRGIFVCDRWLIFDNFLNDMGLAPSQKHTIERIDNNKGYEPENCTWATRETQSKNNRKNVYLTIKGETKWVGDWAKIFNTNSQEVLRRIKLGWPVLDALKTPIKKVRKNLTVQIQGIRKPITFWCKKYKIKHSTVWTRVSRGQDFVSAITTPLKRKNKNG